MCPKSGSIYYGCWPLLYLHHPRSSYVSIQAPPASVSLLSLWKHRLISAHISLCKHLDLHIISIKGTLMMSVTSNTLTTYNNGKRKLNTDDVWLWMERRLIHLRNRVSEMFSVLGVSCKNMKLWWGRGSLACCRGGGTQ